MITKVVITRDIKTKHCDDYREVYVFREEYFHMGSTIQEKRDYILREIKQEFMYIELYTFKNYSDMVNDNMIEYLGQ